MLENLKEKELMLEKARLISMELAKVKILVMKSVKDSQTKAMILSGLKEFDNAIK